MADYEPKTEGITYLRHAIIQQRKRKVGKFITIPMSQAEKIVSQAEDFVPRKAGWDYRRNSERAAALILGLEPKELVAKLDAPDMAKVLNDLAEAKNYIKWLEESGDILYNHSTSGVGRAGWLDARKYKINTK
jgi:hypothetical protein